MAQITLSIQQIIDKNQCYQQYRDALHSIWDLHSTTSTTLTNSVESRLKNFLESKSSEAQLKVTSEIEKSQDKAQEKICQLEGHDDPTKVVAKALAQFDNHVEEAKTSFNGSMTKAGDALKIVIRGVYADQLKGWKDWHVNSVKETWKTFNEKLRDGKNSARRDFESEIVYATRDFATAKNHFLKGLENLCNDEYETAVTRALAGFQKSMSKAEAYFFVDRPVLNNVIFSPAVKKPLDIPSTLEKIVQDVAKIAQRLDNLEGKMQEIFKSVQVPKDFSYYELHTNKNL